MKSKSIRSRLFMTYSLLILMILLTVAITISAVFSNFLLENSRRNIAKRLSDIELQLQEEIHGIISVCDEVKNESDVRYLLESYRREEGWRPSYNEIFRVHDKAVDSDYVISRLLLINRDLLILDPVYERVLYREAIINNEDFIEFLQGNYFYHFSAPGTFPFETKDSADSDELTIVLYQKLLDENYWLMGYLLAVLRKEALFGPLWLNNRDRLFDGITVFSSRNEVVHQEGLKISASDIKTDFSETVDSHPVSVELNAGDGNAERYMVLMQPVAGINWYLTGLVPYSRIFSELRSIIGYIIIAGIVFIIVAFTVSYFLAGSITRPLFSITDAMHAYDESMALEPIDINAEGELGYLVRVYNRLVGSINRYIENVYEEQEKKKEAELVSLQYELDFLQAQINPHFIHNTLNAIGHQAEKAGNSEVFESLKSFNLLLRASVSGTQDLITLEEELKLVGNFVRILRLRYGDRFTVGINIAAGLEKMQVPKLILQPIVENSIFHGIEPVDRPGEIEILAERSSAGAVITIRDNGLGMSPDEIKRILQPEKMTRQFNRVGLKNVDDRIKILFGEEYGVRITSSEAEGTAVSISMPL